MGANAHAGREGAGGARACSGARRYELRAGVVPVSGTRHGKVEGDWGGPIPADRRLLETQQRKV